ncbi:MAG TPA: hypothetical protein VFP55_12545 [Solirubrobacteraceae bacterium]|nr:hypothetical protein [Solirubrobacteraceae bacterium]
MNPSHRHTYSSADARTRVLLDDAMMREILADVGQMRTALELELWASWILGQTWRQRTRQPLFSEVDWTLTVGAPMVAMIAHIGGARARKALTAISMLERGPLGHYAGAIALTLPGARTPAWMGDIADARFTRARIPDPPVALDAADLIVLDLERGGRHELSVAVLLDAVEEARVEEIQICGPLPDGQDPDGAEPAAWSEVDLAAAATHIARAIRVIDRDPRPRVNPQVADLRAFLLARLLDAGAAADTVDASSRLGSQ